MAQVRDSKQSVISYFDDSARKHFGFPNTRLASFFKQAERQIVFRMVRNVTDAKVLDAGCGPGHYIRNLLPLNNEVTGIDASPGMTQLCRRTFQDGKLDLAVADLEHIPLRAASFNLIICVDTLQYFSDKERQAILHNLISLLRPGGQIIVDVKNSGCPYFWFKPFRDRMASYYTISSVTKVLKERGSRQITVKGIHLPARISPICVVMGHLN